MKSSWYLRKFAREAIEKYPSIRKMALSIAGRRRRGSPATVNSYIPGIRKSVDFIEYDNLEEALADIRARARTRELVEAEQKAEAGRIATMVAHDLRSLLQKIKDDNNLLRREPEKKEEILKAVEDSVDFATRRLKEILYRTQESTQNSYSPKRVLERD